MKVNTKYTLQVLGTIFSGLLFFALLNLLIAWLFSLSEIFQFLWVLVIYIIPELIFILILVYLCYLGIKSLDK